MSWQGHPPEVLQAMKDHLAAVAFYALLAESFRFAERVEPRGWSRWSKVDRARSSVGAA